MLADLFQQEALFFSIPAVLGTTVFLIRLGLMSIGGFADGVDGVDVDIDCDADIEAGDSTQSFELLSVQSVAAFLMGFGWGGVGGLIGFDWSFPMSMLAGAVFGAGMVWLLGMLMKAMYDLSSSGNVNIQDAVGAEGTVYTNVPAKGGGRGQVRVVVNLRARFYNAVSDGDAIVTNSSIRVVRVNDDHTLTVTSV